MCRSDKKLLKYELNVTLAEQVNETESYFADQGVGKVFLNMTKVEQPSRWKSLLTEGQQKPPNMNVWWEMFEKHEKELDKLSPEDDDDEYEDLDDGDEKDFSEPKKKKIKKKNKKGRNQSKTSSKNQKNQQAGQQPTKSSEKS